MIDFDGTWFRLQPDHAKECTLNVVGAGQAGALLALWNDKHANSLFRVIDDDGCTFRLQVKHCQSCHLTPVDGGGHGKRICIWHDKGPYNQWFV